MQLRNAQQEYENEGGLRNALSGGLPDDPSSLLKYGKQGRAVYESALKGRKEKLESSQKRIDMMGGLAGFVREQPTPENFQRTLSQAVQYGLMTPEQAKSTLAQYGDDPAKIKSFADQTFNQAITAKDKLHNETLIANNAATVAASYYGHNVSAANNQRTVGATIRGQDLTDARAREGTWTPVIVGDRVMQQNNRTGEIREAVDPSGTVTIGAPVTLPEQTGGAASPNALAPQPTAATSTNALVNPQNPSGIKQPLTAFDPKKVVRQETNAAGDVTGFNSRGEIVSVAPKAGKPSAATEKEQAVIQKIPEAIAISNDAIRKIDEMIGAVDAKGNPVEGKAGQPHPGFKGLTGAVGLGGSIPRFFAGSNAKNFEIRHNEIMSQSFLEAFETLKGGGAISEKEGIKATAAKNRMDLAQSPEEYMTAAREFQGYLKRGIANAERRAAQGIKTPANTGDIASNPDIDALLNKYK